LNAFLFRFRRFPIDTDAQSQRRTPAHHHFASAFERVAPRPDRSLIGPGRGSPQIHMLGRSSSVCMIAVRDGGRLGLGSTAIRYLAISLGYRQEATFITENISKVVFEIGPISRAKVPNVPRNRAISTFSRKRVVGAPRLEIYAT
jgi:hypothetical protein